MEWIERVGIDEEVNGDERKEMGRCDMGEGKGPGDKMINRGVNERQGDGATHSGGGETSIYGRVRGE